MVHLRHRILVIAAVIAVSVSCSRPVIQQYQKDGIQFQHYSNWEISKDAPIKDKPNIRSIQIHGPDDALISLICLPAASTQSLEDYAAEVAKLRIPMIESKLNVGSLKLADVSKGTSAPGTATIAGKTREGIFQQFTVELAGTQVPHEAKFYLVTGSRYRIMVMFQVAVEHAVDVHTGSELILNSLSIDGIS